MGESAPQPVSATTHPQQPQVMAWEWQGQLPALGMLSGDRHHSHSLLALLMCSWHRGLLCAEPREKPGLIPADDTLPLEQAQQEELVLVVVVSRKHSLEEQSLWSHSGQLWQLLC